MAIFYPNIFDEAWHKTFYKGYVKMDYIATKSQSIAALINILKRLTPAVQLKDIATHVRAACSVS